MLAPLLLALQTLTRLPVPSPKSKPDARMIGRSALFYPLVGALLGAAAVALEFAAGKFLPRGVVMLLILALWALLTGGLHEDGLADTADAFGAGRSRDDILRILKDSRIGVYGALALILATLLRWQGLSHLSLADTSCTLMASQVLPRAGVLWVAFGAGPTTEASGGTLASSLRVRHLAGSMLTALTVLAAMAAVLTWTATTAKPIAFPRGFEPLLPAAAACAVTAAAATLYFRRRLGGVTGDCLGAAVQLQEIAVILAVVAWGAGA